MGLLKKLFGRQEPETNSEEADKPEEPRGPIMADKGTDASPSLPDDGPHRRRSWIGVDLDGTLAKYDGWRGFDHIGEPIEGMRERVEEWMAQGYTVKIFTARASDERGIPPVKTWLKEHGMPDLDVTCSKDFDMIEVWDDRAVQVVPNTGSPVLSPRFGALPRAPLFGIEHRGKKAE